MAPAPLWTALAGGAHLRRRPASISFARRANKDRRYPADPPTVAEMVTVMRAAGDRPDGLRKRALIVFSGAQACGSARLCFGLGG